MSLIPSRYVCSTCGNYVDWVGQRRRPAHRCRCEEKAEEAEKAARNER